MPDICTTLSHYRCMSSSCQLHVWRARAWSSMTQQRTTSKASIRTQWTTPQDFRDLNVMILLKTKGLQSYKSRILSECTDCSIERSRTVFRFWLNAANCVVYMQCALIIHSLFDNNNDVYSWFGPFHIHYISLESAATKVSNISVTKQWNVATLTWGPLDPKKPAMCSFPNGLKRVKWPITQI